MGNESAIALLRDRKIALAVFIASLIPFLPALSNGFVNWDDPNFITLNPIIQGLVGANIKAMFTSFVDGNYIPLTFLSFAANFAVHGLQPAGYHATNIVLHGINAVLVFLLLRRLGGSSISAAFGALLFSLHPLRVESVAWATERKDVLFALFYLLSLLAYLRHLDARSLRPFLVSLFLFFCSGLSKQMAISLPVVLLILDFAKGRKWEWRVLFEKIPFALVALGFVAVAYFGQHSSGSIMRGMQYTPLHRVLLACNSLTLYLKGFLWPLNLSAIYPFPRDVIAEAAYTPFVILVVVLAVFFGGKRYRPVWIAGLFFIITLIPVLNVVPAGSQMVADRFLYLPSIGISYLIAVATAGGWACWTRLRRQTALASAVALLVVLSALSWQRTKVWKDDLALWTDTVRKAPDSFIAFSNLGLARINAGDFAGAVRDFTTAIQLSPSIADPYSNRGQANRELNKHDAALADITMAITLEPESAIFRFNRAELYLADELYERAVADYTRVLELNPKFSGARTGRGISLGMLGKFEESAADFTVLLAANPDDDDSRFNRGKAYYESGRLKDALSDFNTIIEHDPAYAKARLHRALVLLDLSRPVDAWADIQFLQRQGYDLPAEILDRIPAALRKLP